MSLLNLAVLGVFVALILLVAYVLTLFVVHPIWVIVDVYRNQAVSQQKKALWVGAIAVVGPLASLVYGLFFSTSKKLWLGSAVAISIAVGLGLSYTFVPPSYKELVQATFHRTVASDLIEDPLKGVDIEGSAISPALKKLLMEKPKPRAGAQP